MPHSIKRVTKMLDKASEEINNVLSTPISDTIQETLIAFTEAITGITKSTPQDGMITIARLAQRVASGQKLNSIYLEFEELRKKGRIKDGYETSLQAQYTLMELLNFLDEELPDEERFQALRRIFLLSATEERYDRDSLKPQQFMRIIRTLSSSEVIVLKACYNLSKDPSNDDHNLIADHFWFEKVASESNLGFPEIVANTEEALMNKRLIIDRVGNEKRISLAGRYRLTNLGYEIVDYINQYEAI